MRAQAIDEIARGVVSGLGVSRDAGLLGCGVASSPFRYDAGRGECWGRYECGGMGLVTCCEVFACREWFICPPPAGFACHNETWFICEAAFTEDSCGVAYVPTGGPKFCGK